MLELTYYEPVSVGYPVVYAHECINIGDSSCIKWMKNNRLQIKLNNTTKTTIPGTMMSVEGLGVILVKQRRTEIKRLLKGVR